MLAQDLVAADYDEQILGATDGSIQALNTTHGLEAIEGMLTLSSARKPIDVVREVVIIITLRSEP